MAHFRQFKTPKVFILIVSFVLMAASLPAETMDYLMDVWMDDNGLPDSSVTAIVQTPDGYLWIGTYNGLVRFDGARFVTFDPLNTPALKHARVDGLFVDARGTLWVNTRDGSMTAWRNGVFTDEWKGTQVSAVFSHSNQIFFALLLGQLVCRTGNLDGHGEWQGTDRLEVVLAEVSDGLEVGGLFTGEPDQFDIALAFRFEHPGGTDAMQITTEVKFEQHGRIVRRPAGVGATRLGKTEGVQILLGDEGVEEAHGICGGDVIFQALGEEQRLGPVQTGAMIHA